MSIRFIGNKQKLVDFIIEKVLNETGLKKGTFVDLFTGTTSVAMAFKKLNFDIVANDKLFSSVDFAKAGLLINEEPSFNKLLDEIKIGPNSLFDAPYDLVLNYLNNLSGIEGLFYKEYSPEGSKHLEEPRKYFTNENAKKIDAIRTTVRFWRQSNLISDLERALIISSLMLATNQVANISGTYGAYLKSWYDRALYPIELKRYPIISGNKSYKVFHEDANTLVKDLDEHEIVYIDPPYTKRQYSAYYHVLETLSIGDDPVIWGKTGQRERQDDSTSLYCYKRKAAAALNDLITNVQAKHIFMSYSTDGHISHEEIINILSSKGDPKFWEVSYKRFKSNNPKAEGKKMLKEILYYVKVNSLVYTKEKYV